MVLQAVADAGNTFGCRILGRCQWGSSFWSPPAAVLTLVSLGSEITVVKTEPIGGRCVAATVLLLSNTTADFGSRILVAMVPSRAGAG